MDEDVRKAYRVLERAGIKGLLPEDEFIISKAIEGFRQDDKILSSYFPDTFQTTTFIEYLKTGNRDEVISYSDSMLRGFLYHLGLVKFLVDESKRHLSQ